MDSEVALTELRSAVEDFIVGSDNMDSDLVDSASSRMAEYAGALDEWLSKGGALPADWRMTRMVGA